MQQPAVRKTAKQRRERERKEKLARKKCPVGGIHTLDMNKSLAELDSARANSLKSAGVTKKSAENADSNIDVLKVFCCGYKKNWRGQPATDRDRAAKQADEQFLRDYLTGDESKRKPHLDRIMKEVLSMKFTPDLLSQENVEKNIAGLKSMMEKAMFFEDLLEENPLYYFEIPPLERELIQHNKKLAISLYSHLKNMAALKGIDIDTGNIIGHDMEIVIDIARMSADSTSREYSEACRTYDERFREAVLRQMPDKVRENISVLLKDCKKVEDKFREDGEPIMEADIRFSYEHVPMPIRENIYAIQTAMWGNHAAYQQNKDLIDKLYAEYFQVNDRMADIGFKTNALQMCCDEYYEVRDTYRKRISLIYAHEQDDYNSQFEELTARALALRNALEHFLKGKELDSAGEKILKKYGAAG